MKLATLLIVTLSLLLALPAAAQVVIGPAEDHFKVYDVPEKIPFPAFVGLNDQFGPSSADTLVLDKFATPVSKNGEPMLDPVRHLTWWRIRSDPQPGRQVVLENQFGLQTWMVYDGMYLLVPAVKNGEGQLEPHNHYKCYRAAGGAVNLPVILVDQFGTVDVIAADPVLFCNPVEKIDAAGLFFPIVDPEAHLAVYRLDPPMPYGIPVFAEDQFGLWQFTLAQHEWLCVPSYKQEVVPTRETSWGRIKSLY